MRILLISDITNVLDKTLDVISEQNFCDFCVSLGDVSTGCLNKIKSVLKCDFFTINGDKDDEILITNQIFHINGKQMCCINYSKQYEYWEKETLKKFQNVFNHQIEILFTHHSPKEYVDMYGLPDKPDYIRNLVKFIKPKINIHGHENQCTIGTMKEYKQPDITVIGITGIVLLELNNEYQIKKFVAIQ